MNLQIVIPTYNRPAQLARTLEALRPQLSGVVVHVIDNGSSPPTRMAAGMNAFADMVRWHENPANIGGSGNILRCFEVADSEHFWLLSDDDGPTHDSIAKVRSLLEAFPDTDFAGFSTGFARHASTQHFETIEGLLSIPDALRGTTLISSGVYRTSTFRKLLPEAYGHAGSNFPHVALVMLACQHTPFKGVLSSDLIADWKPKADTGNWPILLMFNLLQLSELLDSKELKERFIRAVRFDSAMYFRMLIELAHLRTKSRLTISRCSHFVAKVMCHYQQARPLRGKMMSLLAKMVIQTPFLSLFILRIAYRKFKGREFVSYSREGQQHF